MPIPETLTITGGACGVLYAIFRAVWPYFRDTYLPELLKIKREQSQAFRDIADLVKLQGVHLQHIETRLGSVETGINDLKLRQAIEAQAQAQAQSAST
jgi:hypothetical protein